MSGRVRDQFAALGWEAWSADILPSETPVQSALSRGDKMLPRIHGPERLGLKNNFHYQGDVRDLFKDTHPVNAARLEEWASTPGIPGMWDLIIAHPPCTDLSYAGARWFKDKDARRGGDGRMQAAAEFFIDMWHAPSPLVAVENPHSIIQTWEEVGPPTQVVQPWWFGDPYEKQIHLWLKGLPELWRDAIVTPLGRVTTGGGSWRTDKAAQRKAMSAYEDSEGRKNRAKVRSRTLPGLARAMAEQWGGYAEFCVELEQAKRL
jgi:hypothetical protein